MEHLPFVLLFALFSPLWWLLVILASVAVLWSLDNERGGLAGFSVVVLVGAMVLFGDLKLPTYIIENPGTILAIVAGYFVGGGIWSIVKWSLFSQERRDDYEDAKRNWLKDQGVSGKDVPDNLKAAFCEFLLDDHSGRFSKNARDISVDDKGVKTVTHKRVVDIVPIAWDNKSRIMTWMCFWPWSALWALIDDFVRKVFKRIQRALEALMDRIAQFHFRDAHKDYTIVGKAPERKLDPQSNSFQYGRDDR